MQPIFNTAALSNNLQCVCDTVSFKEFTQSVQDGDDNGGQKNKNCHQSNTYMWIFLKKETEKRHAPSLCRS